MQELHRCLSVSRSFGDASKEASRQAVAALQSLSFSKHLLDSALSKELLFHRPQQLLRQVGCGLFLFCACTFVIANITHLDNY